MVNSLRSLLLLLTSMELAACGGGGSGGGSGPPNIASIAVTPMANALVLGANVQLTATAMDANGGALAGRVITWSSSNPSVAAVTSSGLVTASAVGSTNISAASEGKSGAATVSVTDPVATVSVSATTANVVVGATLSLTASTSDAAGHLLTGRVITWSSSNATIASVSSAGLVTAVAVGSASITATSEGHQGASTIGVISGPITPFLQKPFTGEYLVYNPFDHDFPEEGVDHNGRVVTTDGELTVHGDGHSGYDFLLPIGTPVFAAAGGVVNGAGASTFDCTGLGTVTQLGVQIQHLISGNPEYWTYYAHLSRVDVTVGQTVTAGQQIGLSGNTGCSTAPHLHFQLDRVTGTNTGQLVVVDPYGWTGTTADPWEVSASGAKSLYSWLAGQAPESMIGLNENIHPLNDSYSGTGTKPIGITAVRYQGEHDEVNPNNEYVEIKIDPSHFAGATYSLTGHYLKDNAGDRFDFPANFAIAQGQTVRVYVGSGIATADTLYWGQSAGVFSRSGDCAQLIFPDGGYYLLGWDVSCH